jgi:hypothetical protein
VSDSPGQDIIDAIIQLQFACERIGIKHPALLGMHSGIAVNAIEQALVAAGKADLIRETTGGIEVLGLKIKPRLS